MNTTLNITEEITDFARRVRTQLADLSVDEVDELTDGLEADLAEAFAETPDFSFGEPAAYALELRTAAGLPVTDRSRASITQSFAGVAHSIHLKREGMAANLRRNPAMATTLDALVELRPAWWLLRAWVAFQLVAAFFGREGSTLPFDLLGWVVLLVFAAVSVQWGRKQWLPFGWLAGLIVVGNIAAAMLLVPAAAMANTWEQPYEYWAYSVGRPEPAAGVTLDGHEVTNIFAYGADGKPLTGVQLFDQDGNPLRTSVPGGNGCLDPECNETGFWVPSTLETGVEVFNVFPMQMMAMIYDEMTGEYVPDPAATPQDRPAPFIKVPSVLVPKAEGTPDAVEKRND